MCNERDRKRLEHLDSLLCCDRACERRKHGCAGLHDDEDERKRVPQTLRGIV
jgi:hypothetical protein